MTVKLLVVEDDPTIGEPLVEGLEHEGFGVAWVRTGGEALAAARADLILLDLGLPDLDGREVCRRLRAVGDTPIIVLTARDDELERVLLLETGADDYVLKPFGFRELVARIRAVHRRSGRAPAPAEAPVPGLEVDLAAHRVRVRGEPCDLTPKEFDLLARLAADAGRAVTRETLIDDVWDENWWGPTKTLDVHIAALRKKLGEPTWITTLRGVGYRLDVAEDEGGVVVVEGP